MRIKAHNKGFGLIEIMIALVLGLVLVLGITQIFASSRQTSLVRADPYDSGAADGRDVWMSFARIRLCD